MRTLHIVLVVLAAAAGCAVAPTPDEGSWVGTITAADGITTVVTESGSVWGGTARLVEETSIGVEAGAEEYLFGGIESIYATDDLIYVVDNQVPAVRAYDHDGNFVRTFGRRGQGPGEYSYPGAVAADASGRVFVRDNRNARINVYTADGDVLDSWPKPVSVCCWPMYPLPGDAVWAAVVRDVPTAEPSELYDSIMRGGRAFGPEGPLGEPLLTPEIEYERATYATPSGYEASVPFSPLLAWAPTPDGKLIVGASDRYRFERIGRRGTELVVQRHVERAPISAEHKEWARQLEVVFERDINRAEIDLDASQIPDHTPAFDRLTPALSGETWVVRRGASVRLPDCPGSPLDVGHQTARERPCWANEQILDVFGADGRYLGDVDVPEGVRVFFSRLFVDRRRVIAEHQDADGTITVKRYRLVLPGREAH